MCSPSKQQIRILHVTKTAYLELQLHVSVPRLVLWYQRAQFLYVRVQLVHLDLCDPTEQRFSDCLVYEEVLVLRLYHVGTLGAKERDMAVDVQSIIAILQSLQHRVNDNIGPTATNSCDGGWEGHKYTGIQSIFKYLAEFQYRIAEKFGGELNLVVWQSILQPPN